MTVTHSTKNPAVRAAVNKRSRELQCLADIAITVGMTDIAIETKIDRIAKLLLQAFDSDGAVSTQIILRAQTYTGGTLPGSTADKTVPILVDGELAGTIGISFSPLPDGSSKRTLAASTTLLLNTVAECVGHMVEHHEAQEYARREHATVQHFLHIAGTMLMALDARGTVTMINRKGCEILERNEEDIIGTNWFETFLPASSRDMAKDIFQELMSGNLQNYRIVDGHTVVTGSGREKMMKWHNSPIRNEEDTIIGTLSSGEDVTEQVLGEKALRESEEKFSKAFRASPSMLTITTLEDGTFVDVNDSFVRYSGYSRDELIGRTTIAKKRWIESGERTELLNRLAREGHVRNMEIRSIAKSGELRLGLLSAETVDIGGKRCIISLIEDVTEQRQNRQLVETIYENSPLGMYIVQDGKLQYTNQQFRSMTGYREAELANMKLERIVVPEDRHIIRTSTEDALRGDYAYPCEFRLRRPDGTTVWVVQRVAPLFYYGRRAILCNLLDISPRKSLERKVTEYEELTKMKSDLLATVSHELRTPLTTIKGYSTMMLDYYDRLETGEMKDYLKAVDQATDRLSRLVDNLLDTSRMEAGLLRLERRQVDPGQLIRSAVDEARLRTHSHTIDAVIENGLPRVVIDTRRIRQVLDNLVENAAKYSLPGGTVTITARHTGRRVTISVADEGPGLPADELTNIFKRMYRLEHRGGGEGMGLGLYIAQQIITAHGGKIRAESQPGKGCVIKFTLPIAKKARSRSAGSRERTASHEKR